MEVRHTLGWQGNGVLHLAVRLVWGIFSIKLAVCSEGAVHVNNRDNEELQLEGIAIVSAQMCHHSRKMTTSRCTSNSQSGDVQVELDGSASHLYFFSPRQSYVTGRAGCKLRRHADTTYPLDSRPAILNGGWVRMLGGKTVVDIEDNNLALKLIGDPLALVVVGVEVAKHPAASVEVDIGPTLLVSAWGQLDGRHLKDADGDGPSVDRELSLRDAEDLWPWSLAIVDHILAGVLAELLDGDLVGMKPARVVAVVVLDIHGVKPAHKLLWDAIDQWLESLLGLHLEQRRVCHALCSLDMIAAVSISRFS